MCNLAGSKAWNPLISCLREDLTEHYLRTKVSGRVEVPNIRQHYRTLILTTVVHRFVRYSHLENLPKLGKSLETPRKSRFHGPRTFPRLPRVSTRPATMFQSVSERPEAIPNDFSIEIYQKSSKILQIPSDPSKSSPNQRFCSKFKKFHPFSTLLSLPRVLDPRECPGWFLALVYYLGDALGPK